ncbi:MAG: two-component regulator propeller domain-containing protein, partial [Bacteroidota bacterium]
MIHKRLLLLFFVLAGTLTAIAQEHSYRHYSVQDGLVQSQVLSIFQDSKGFLWVGTKGGVSRFDGKNFLNFTSKDGLPDNQVYKITEDYQGIIWFLTQDGLAKFDGNQLTAYPTKHFKPSSSFVIFCETKPGELLIVFHRFKQEVFFLSFSNGEYKVLPSVYHEKMLDPETYSILGEYDSVEKAIWLAIPTSQLIKIKNNQITYLPVSTKLPQGLKLGNDGKLYLMDDGKVYVNSNDSIIHIATANTLNFSLNNISNFEVDKKGVIYLYNKHLFLYRNKSWEKEYFNFNNVIVIYIDNEDNLWIGSETGLYRLISRAFVNFIPEKCGINHLIWSIAEDKNGRIKFASYEYGLQDFDGKKIVNDKSFENLVIGEKNYFYMGSIVDNEKNILFTSAPAGGLKYDGKKFSRIFPDTTTIATFIFYEDPDNFDLLAGTNRGLFIKSKSKGLINQHITPGNGRSNFIVSIVKDKYKRYWLGGFKCI